MVPCFVAIRYETFVRGKGSIAVMPLMDSVVEEADLGSEGQWNWLWCSEDPTAPLSYRLNLPRLRTHLYRGKLYAYAKLVSTQMLPCAR
jgi:hypothetical protein